MAHRQISKCVLLLALFCFISGGKKRVPICRSNSFCSCYLSKKDRIEIYCFNTNDLEPVQNLLQTKFQNRVIRRLSLTMNCSLTSLNSSSFGNFSIKRISLNCPISDVDTQAFSGIKDLSRIDLGNTTFLDIPQGLRNLKDLGTLTFTNHNLKSLGHEPWNMSSLKVLSIQYGFLEELPKVALTEMPNLETINFSHNLLKYINPETWSNMSTLKNVYLGHNEITTVEDIFKGINIELIDLKYNHLTEINSLFSSEMNELETLDISGNYFPSIDSSTFGRKFPKLKQFLMERVDCTSISNFTFPEYFPRLRRAFLGFNDLQGISKELFNHHKNLEVIDLQSNRINCSEFLFYDLPRLHALNLQHNSITEVSYCFQFLRAVEIINLSYNKLQHLRYTDFLRVERLRILNLAHNLIETIGTKIFLKLPFLKTLELSNNRLHQLNGSLIGADSLNHLVINSSPLLKLKADDFSTLRQLKVLDLNSNAMTTVDGFFRKLPALLILNLANNLLTTVTKETFPDDIKLNELRLAHGNPWNCDCKLMWLFHWLAVGNNSDILKDSPKCSSPPSQEGKLITEVRATEVRGLQDGCPSSCHCECALQEGHSYFSIDCSNRNMTQFPQSLPTNLEFLNLSSNALQQVKLPANLEELFSLDLDHNNIVRFETDSSAEQIKDLRLSYNLFTRPPSSLFQSNHLNVVKLSNNPWICDCETDSFRRWIIDNKRKVIDFSETTCGPEKTRKGLHGKVISSLEYSDLCPSSIGKYIGITAGCICFFLVPLLALYFYFRHHIKSLLYARGFAFVKEEEMDVDANYDAYLSYSYIDENFVFSNIAPKLEAEEPMFSLHIPDREVLRTDMFLQAINKSKRIIIILNENYVNDQYSMSEFQCAYRKCLEDRTKHLIFIKTGNIPSSQELDSNLKRAMKSHLCLSWGEKFFWERLRYAMPKKTTEEDSSDEELILQG